MIVCSFRLQAQTIGEWLALPPVPVEIPAFGSVKNVEGKTFVVTIIDVIRV